jgi:DNA-binding MarR family transcriptional regulator
MSAVIPVRPFDVRPPLAPPPDPPIRLVGAIRPDDHAPSSQLDGVVTRTLASILKARRSRDELLPGLFADPAWDILLFLLLSRREGQLATVSDACVAAAVPTSTALRVVTSLERRGLIARWADTKDRRRSYLKLSDQVEATLLEWLHATMAKMSVPVTAMDVSPAGRPRGVPTRLEART